MSIGNRILLLTLLPSIGLAVMLTTYVLSDRANELQSRLLSKAEFTVNQLSAMAGLVEFAEDAQTLEKLARITLQAEGVTSVSFIDKNKRPIVSLGTSMQHDNLAEQQVVTASDRSIQVSAPVNDSQGRLMGWVQVIFSRADTVITGYRELIWSSLLISLSVLFALLLSHQTSKHISTSVLSYTNHIYDRMRTSSMALGNTHGGCTSDHTYTGTKETT